MSQIFVKQITPIESVPTTNLIICRWNVADERIAQLSVELESHVEGKENLRVLEANEMYAIQTSNGWQRCMVKFSRKSDNMPVLQMLDHRAQPIDFDGDNTPTRKISNTRISKKVPVYFKMMIHGLGKYFFDDEYYLCFEQLFKKKMVTGVVTLIESKYNRIHECYVGDLFYEVDKKLLSFRELLIRENIAYPSRSRNQINQRLYFTRKRVLRQHNQSIAPPFINPSAVNPTDLSAASSIDPSVDFESNKPGDVICGTVNELFFLR